MGLQPKCVLALIHSVQVLYTLVPAVGDGVEKGVAENGIGLLSSAGKGEAYPGTKYCVFFVCVRVCI